MPISTKLDKTRAQVAEPLSRRDIDALASDPDVRVVQASSPLTLDSWRQLDAELFSRRPDIALRVYGFYSSECDLSFARCLSNVRHFSADSLQHAVHVDSIAAIPSLESLSIGIFDLDSFDVLDDVSPALTRLALGATRSKKPSLARLGRFTKLRELYLEGQQKHIETLAQIRTLEDLTLRSITTPDVRYLSGLAQLWSLDIKLGGIRDLSAIREIPFLEYLELWQIRGLRDVTVVSDLVKLQNMFLQSLPHVASIPPLQHCRSLRRIVLENMRGLRDLSALASAPALEEFLLVKGETLMPEDLLPLLRNPSVTRVGAFFGSEKRNRDFAAMAEAKGKAKFRGTPFEYR